MAFLQEFTSQIQQAQPNGTCNLAVDIFCPVSVEGPDIDSAYEDFTTGIVLWKRMNAAIGVLRSYLALINGINIASEGRVAIQIKIGEDEGGLFPVMDEKLTSRGKTAYQDWPPWEGTNESAEKGGRKGELGVIPRMT